MRSEVVDDRSVEDSAESAGGIDAVLVKGSVGCPAIRDDRVAGGVVGLDEHGFGVVVVVTAGTSDLPVAEEAREVALAFGCEVSLLADVGVPLVMTSGNVSDEPIAFRDPADQNFIRGRLVRAQRSAH